MGLIVDNFAGGGGASVGIEQALGRPIDIAINHDPAAILMHKTNHPYTRHYQESVWDVDIRAITNGEPVDLVWCSPDCKHFSKAKGGKPVNKEIRGLAWVAIKWAGTVKPKVIILENVEEFQTWGPIKDGMGFPETYIIDKDYTGKPYPTSEQKARCGNAVVPALAKALVAANVYDRIKKRKAKVS